MDIVNIVETVEIVDIVYIMDIIMSHGNYEISIWVIGTFHKDQIVWRMRCQIVGEIQNWEITTFHLLHFGAPQKW